MELAHPRRRRRPLLPPDGPPQLPASASLGHPLRRRQRSFLDAVWAVFLLAVVIFLALVFIPRREDPCSPPPPCAASEVDLLPLEDPRRSSRLSREMNYYSERHCPARDEAPRRGYRVPVP